MSKVEIQHQNLESLKALSVGFYFDSVGLVQFSSTFNQILIAHNSCRVLVQFAFLIESLYHRISLKNRL